MKPTALPRRLKPRRARASPWSIGNRQSPSRGELGRVLAKLQHPTAATGSRGPGLAQSGTPLAAPLPAPTPLANGSEPILRRFSHRLAPSLELGELMSGAVSDEDDYTSASWRGVGARGVNSNSTCFPGHCRSGVGVRGRPPGRKPGPPPSSALYPRRDVRGPRDERRERRRAPRPLRGGRRTAFWGDHLAFCGPSPTRLGRLPPLASRATRRPSQRMPPAARTRSTRLCQWRWTPTSRECPLAAPGFWIRALRNRWCNLDRVRIMEGSLERRTPPPAFDAKFHEIQIPEGIKVLLHERAFTSPIWYMP